MTIRYRIVIIVIAILGCSPVKPEDGLTHAQAIIVLRELLYVDGSFTDGSTGIPCPLDGGSYVTVATHEEVRGDTVLYDVDVTIVPDGCVISAVGDTLVLNGDPEVVTKSKSRRVGLFGDIELGMRSVGDITWSRGGDSVGCHIDMTLAPEEAEVDENEGSIRGYMRGVLCGREAVIDFSEVDR